MQQKGKINIDLPSWNISLVMPCGHGEQRMFRGSSVAFGGLVVCGGQVICGGQVTGGQVGVVSCASALDRTKITHNTMPVQIFILKGFRLTLNFKDLI